MRLKAVLFVAMLFVLACRPGNSCGQDARRAIRGSSFSRTTEAMGSLIRLWQVDGRLQLLKQWSPKSEICRKIEKYTGRDISLEKAREYARDDLNRERLKLSTAFQKVLDKSEMPLDQNSSDEYLAPLEGYYSTTKSQVSMQFFDDDSEVDVSFCKSEEGDFLFRLQTPDTMMELRQTTDDISLLVVEGGEASIVYADNFELLMKQHPAMVVMKLLPVWRLLGVKKPLSFSDSDVVAGAIARLSSEKNDTEEVKKHLQGLLNDLAVDRDASHKILAEKNYLWEPLIEKYAAEMELDHDATERIVEISQFARPTSTQRYIKSINLNDAETLLKLWSNTPEEHHPLILARLELVVGEFLGNNLADWKAGLEVWQPPKSRRTSNSIRDLVQQSGLSKIHRPINLYIPLAENDGTLSVFGNWTTRLKREVPFRSHEEYRKARVDREVALGVDRATAERHADFSLNNRKAEDEQLGKKLAFQQLSEPFRQGVRSSSRSASHSGGQSKFQLETPEFSVSMRAAHQYLFLHFRDQEAGIDLSIRDLKGNRFWFQIVAQGQMIDVIEESNKFRLTVVRDDQTKVYVTKCFQQFVEEFPAESREILFPIWQDLGLGRPLSFSNPEVAAAAVKKIQATRSDEMVVVDLLNQLNSERVETRNDAERELMNNFHCWCGLIERIKDETTLDADALVQLERILETSPGTLAQDYVNQQDLADAETLLLIWENAPPGSDGLMARELKRVTGESAGNNIDAWRKALRAKEPLFID